MNTSITYGQIFNTNSDFDEATGIGDKAYNLVFSADVPLAPGLVLAGDVSKFDNDSHDRDSAPATRAGPRWAASAWRSDRSGARDEAAGLAPPLCVSAAAATRATGSVQALQIEGEELESREIEPRAQGARQPDPSW